MSPPLRETAILYLVLKHLAFAVLQTLKPSTGPLITLICGFQSLDWQSPDPSCGGECLLNALDLSTVLTESLKSLDFQFSGGNIQMLQKQFFSRKSMSFSVWS